MLTYADIFSGCGGLSHSFYTKKQFRGLLAVDAWSAAARVFSTNHPGVPFHTKDLSEKREIEFVVRSLKNKCDILLGGPPCQGFSTLGKRRDSDKRSSLVDSFLKICLDVNPKIIVIENVPGITSKKHPSGIKYSDLVVSTLQSDQAGASYDLETTTIDALDYGLAQTRKRWFLLAVREDVNRKGDVLETIRSQIKRRRARKRSLLKDAIGDLPHIESGGGAEVMIVRNNGSSKVIYNHRAMNHTKRLVERFSHVPVGGGLPDVPRELLTKHLKRMLDGAYGNGGHIKNIYGRLDWDKPAGTIVAGIDKITCGRFVHPEANRLLTPRECARIQSFPDDFRFQGSLVAQYYLIGNAVPPRISAVLADSIQAAMI